MTIVAFSGKVCLCGGGRLHAGWERHGHERKGDEGFGRAREWFIGRRPLFDYEKCEPSLARYLLSTTIQYPPRRLSSRGGIGQVMNA